MKGKIKRELYEFEKSALADFKINEIKIDNMSSEITLICVDPMLKECTFTIEKVLSFSYNHKEPWGKGSYVVSSCVEYDGMTGTIIIEINSGDELIIKFLIHNNLNI